MKFTYVLALVVVFAVVVTAIKPNKAAKTAARKAKMAARKERMERRRCAPYTMSYTECVDGNMTVTRTPATVTDTCQPAILEKRCVEEIAPRRKDCVKKIDRTACGAQGSDIETSTFTITKTCSNRKDKTFTRLCKSGAKAEGKRGKNKKGGNRGKKNRNNKKQ